MIGTAKILMGFALAGVLTSVGVAETVSAINQVGPQDSYAAAQYSFDGLTNGATEVLMAQYPLEYPNFTTAQYTTELASQVTGALTNGGGDNGSTSYANGVLTWQEGDYCYQTPAAVSGAPLDITPCPGSTELVTVPAVASPADGLVATTLTVTQSGPGTFNISLSAADGTTAETGDVVIVDDANMSSLCDVPAGTTTCSFSATATSGTFSAMYSGDSTYSGTLASGSYTTAG